MQGTPLAGERELPGKAPHEKDTGLFADEERIMSSKYDYPPPHGDGRERIPPGATRRASDRTARPGGPAATPLDDRFGAGTPAGGTEVGGLGGSNEGDGSPQDVDLTTAAATGTHAPEAEDGGPPYAGPAGGAVGGTPAEDRSSGGRTGRGLRPEGLHRGDSTLGASPE